MTDKMFNWYVYDRNTIIDRINSMRGKRGSDAYISNDTLSKHLGYSETQVQKWFSKKESVAIPLNCLMEMANLFNCDIDYLLGRIDLPTKEATDIHKETGLSEEAIENMRKAYNYIHHGEQVFPIKLNSKYLHHKRELASELICQIDDWDSLSNKMLVFLGKKQKCEEYKKSTYYNDIMKAYRTVWGDDSFRISFENITDVYELTDIVDIKNYLKDSGYTESQIEEISDKTDGFFSDAIVFEALKEYEIASIQNSLVRFLDWYNLSEVKEDEEM